MKNISPLFVSLIFFTACKFGHSNTQTKDSVLTSSARTDTAAQPAMVAKHFLKWYRDNLDTLYKIKTIAGGPADNSDDKTAKNYFVDFKEVDKYLSTFKKTGFVSDKFIAGEHKAFIEADRGFKKNPANDGPPNGFDYDHILLTQEDYTKDLANLDNIPFTAHQSTSNTAEVTFSLPNCGMKYKYLLSKENSDWLIDEIKNESVALLRSELSLISCQ
ncbi:hypothetical protein ACI6Q2_10345 [Chitinophagaceae bacterium LWZ2-11]